MAVMTLMFDYTLATLFVNSGILLIYQQIAEFNTTYALINGFMVAYSPIF